MAIYCKNCGMELKPGAKFCGRCATPVASDPVGVTEMSSEFIRSHEMPSGVSLGMDEKVVRQYRIGRYTLRKGAVDVIVTNKRVIRYEDSTWFGMRTNRMDDIELKAISGVSCAMSRSISIPGLIFGGSLAVAGLTMMAGNIGVGLLACLVGLVILLCSFRPSMVFCLYGPVSSGMLDTSVNVMGRLFGRNNSSMLFQFKPTSETTAMLREIGACINDLKNLGETAVARWSR